MKVYIIFFFLFCFSSQIEASFISIVKYGDPQLVSSTGRNASGAFFTKDNDNKNILVWTEKLPGGEETGNVVMFAKWDIERQEFDKAIEVESSAGCRSHDESMSKIAFKKDGTVVVVFSKRAPTKENRYAGALFFSQSFDKGNSWTVAKYLHVGDTTRGLSRSFFDIATLSDGEVGAIWLDSRLTKKRGMGSSLFFSKTEGNKGFVKDAQIATETCQCCRTELYISSKGDIHAVFRDIWNDSLRDMSIVTSVDNGASFSKQKRVSEDNWKISGCPHTGPSFNETKGELHCAWYTMGKGRGIYYTNSVNNGKSFNQRRLLTDKGLHPQLLALKNNQIVFVWDERSNFKAHSHASHGSGHSDIVEKKKTESYIKAQVWKSGNPIEEYWVSLPDEFAEYPVATEIEDNKIGVAWVQNIGEANFGIFFRVID